MSAREPPMDEYVHVEEVQEVISDLEERIEEIESDNRYPDEDEERQDVQTNAVLALMQADWGGELRGLKKARNQLEDLA